MMKSVYSHRSRPPRLRLFSCRVRSNTFADSPTIAPKPSNSKLQVHSRIRKVEYRERRNSPDLGELHPRNIHGCTSGPGFFVPAAVPARHRDPEDGEPPGAFS